MSCFHSESIPHEITIYHGSVFYIEHPEGSIEKINVSNIKDVRILGQLKMNQDKTPRNILQNVFKFLSIYLFKIIFLSKEYTEGKMKLKYVNKQTNLEV